MDERQKIIKEYVKGPARTYYTICAAMYRPGSVSELRDRIHEGKCSKAEAIDAIRIVESRGVLTAAEARRMIQTIERKEG